jgi:hypothetical protein
MAPAAAKTTPTARYRPMATVMATSTATLMAPHGAPTRATFVAALV